jgi:glycine C-acetyltransferase
MVFPLDIERLKFCTIRAEKGITPMRDQLSKQLEEEIKALKNEGVYKEMNYLTSPQSALVQMENQGEVIILSSNNYLGLSDHPEVIDAGKKALDKYGAGTASVRFICGTFDIHRDIEKKLATLVGCDASLTYVSCWTANTGLMATVLGEEDIVISDALNHASIIDGVRLCKAQRAVYPHSDMSALEEILKNNQDKKTRFIITDGVFSMEGDIAKLPDILELGKKYNATVCVDDSHATGVIGDNGRGTAEFHGVVGEVDIITSTLGKALGGAAGGFSAGSEALVDYLGQRSRPQLFSNALPPTIAASAMATIDILTRDNSRVKTLQENARYFRNSLIESGFKPLDGETPIVPVIVGETARAIEMSKALLKEGIFVTGFGFPVVPKGAARLRCQISAGHSKEQLDQTIEAFKKVGLKAGLIKKNNA